MAIVCIGGKWVDTSTGCEHKESNYFDRDGNLVSTNPDTVLRDFAIKERDARMEDYAKRTAIATEIAALNMLLRD